MTMEELREALAAAMDENVFLKSLLAPDQKERAMSLLAAGLPSTLSTKENMADAKKISGVATKQSASAVRPLSVRNSVTQK